MKSARLWLVPGLFFGFQMGGCAKEDPGGESTTTTVTSAGDNSSGLVTSVADGGASTSEVPTGGGSTAATAATAATMPTISDSGSSTDHPCDSALGCDDTTGVPDECDVFAQDCPEGQKCVPYDYDEADPGIKTHKCVDVTGVDAPGDNCTYDEGYNDSCIAGSICWLRDGQGEGFCVPLCGGSLEAPTCENTAYCSPSADEFISLCLHECNPLLQDCPDPGDACYAATGRFVCAVDTSGMEGKANDQCSYTNECDEGLLCADNNFVGMGCEQLGGCCTPFCEYPGGACPNPDQECFQLLDPMTLPQNDPLLGVGGCRGLPF